MKFRRAWHGYLMDYPMDPDIALAKHTNWTRSYAKGGIATITYPEPINLIAASAWPTIPLKTNYKHSIIYYDKDTKLWVMAIGTLDLTTEALANWMYEQFSLGARAVWTNDGASPPRPQPTFIHMDNEPGTMGSNSNDPITLTVRLKEMNKYQVGETNLIQLYPEKFSLTQKHAEKITTYDPLNKVRKPNKPRLPGQTSGNSKCVYTPKGVFHSITLAAKEHEISISKMYTLVSGDDEGYGYLTKEEYLRHTTLNNCEVAQSAASN